MTSVTEADREAAASVAVLVEMRELILSGRADHHAEPFTNHRQAGMIEGARLMQEAVIEAIRKTPLGRETIAVRALDPAAIVKGKSDGID